MILQPGDGGVFDHVRRLGASLAAAGHEVMACGPPSDPDTDSPVEAIPVPMVRRVSPRRDLAAALRVAAVVRRVRPDVVHAHSSKAGAVARLARIAFPRTPLVYTAHGYAFAGHFESARARHAYRAAERLLAPLATRVLCVCEAERRLAVQVGPASRTRVVHNGIDPLGPGPTLPLAERARGRGPVIGTVALLRPGKGVETLLDAMPGVLRHSPDATLVVAGDGPERARLDRRIADLGLGGSVAMVGAVHDPGLLMRSIDLFVNPSWAESLPYTLLEAMSEGLPIVATDVGGVGEAIRDGDSGVLVEPRDPEALAAALAAVLGDRGRARSLGSAARVRYEAGFTLSRMVEGTLAVYGEVTP